MEDLLQLVFSWPAVFLTVPVIVALGYWVLALVGALDIDVVDADIELDGADDVSGGVSGLMSTLGLSGVPLPLSISLWVIFAWVPTLYISQWFSPWFADGWLGYALGAGVIAASIVMTLPITVIAIKPFIRFYVTHEARSNRSVCGEVCQITSLKVTESFGQAALEDGGAGLILKVRAKTPNQLTKGSRALVVEYDEPEGCYWVIDSKQS